MTISQIYFPLRSNASALASGPGVAAVRRRILAAALLHDRVILEPGVHRTWAGPAGGADQTAHGEQPARWQSLVERGRATGAVHHVAVRRSDAPSDAPFHAMVQGPATFSWRATYEPFRKELPPSATEWLVKRGHVADPEPRDGRLVENAIVKAGYLDLAVAAVTGSAVSIDRRHQLAITRRIEAGDAQRVGGHYALEILLPVGFRWDDVPDLRAMRALRDDRAIIREVEEAELRLQPRR